MENKETKELLSMSAPDLDDSDIQEVLAVLRSGRLALGPKTEEFEEVMGTYLGVRHAIAVSSGTAGLHLLVRALGLGPGDEVLVPSFTFVASVNALLYEGITPVFVDIEPETYTIDPQEMVKKITPRTKAMMVVDVFGHPAEWDAITTIAREHNLKIIDDSCEALGAEYKGRKLGQFGDGAVFAFYPNKQITTGEGGMVVTNDEKLATLLRSLRNQGRGEMGAWLRHEHLGYNYRMDELSAALGVSQMRKIESLLTKRAQVAQWYTERLSSFSWLRTQVVKPYVRMSWFVYVITLARGFCRDEVIQNLHTLGIPARGYFSPVHLQPYMQKRFGFRRGELPLTEDIAQRTIALPFHNNLRLEEIETVVAGLQESIEKGKENDHHKTIH